MIIKKQNLLIYLLCLLSSGALYAISLKNQVSGCLKQGTPEIAQSFKEECRTDEKNSFHQISIALETKFPVAKSDRAPLPYQEHAQVMKNQKDHELAEKKRRELIPGQEELLKYLVREAKASLSFQEGIAKDWKEKTKAPRGNITTEVAAYELNKKIKAFEGVCQKLREDDKSTLQDRINVAAFTASLFIKDKVVQDLGSTRVFAGSILYPLQEKNFAEKCVKNGKIFTEDPRAAWGKRGMRAVLSMGRSILGPEAVGQSDSIKEGQWAMHDVLKYPYVNPLEIAVAIKQQADATKIVKNRIEAHVAVLKHSEKIDNSRTEELAKSTADYVKYYPALIKKALECKQSNHTSCKSFSSENFVASICQAGTVNAIEKHEREEMSMLINGAAILALPLAFLAPGPGTILLGALLNSSSFVNSLSNAQKLTEDRNQITSSMTLKLIDEKLGSLLGRLLNQEVQSEMATAILSVGGIGLDAISGSALVKSLRSSGKPVRFAGGSTPLSLEVNSIESEAKFTKAHVQEPKVKIHHRDTTYEIQLLNSDLLPPDDRLKKLLKTLEAQGVKVAIGKNPNEFHAVFYAQPNVVEYTKEAIKSNLIVIDPSLLKNESSLHKLLNHEITHWTTLQKTGVKTNYGGILISDSGSLTGPYAYGAFNDEVKTYSRQSLSSLRGKSESEVQEIFKKSDEVSHTEVIKDLKKASSELNYAVDFAIDQKSNFSNLAKEISEEGFALKHLNISADGTEVSVKTGINDNLYALDLDRTTMTKYSPDLANAKKSFEVKLQEAMKKTEDEFRRDNSLGYFLDEENGVADYVRRQVQNDFYKSNPWLHEFEKEFKNHVNLLDKNAIENVNLLNDAREIIAYVEREGTITKEVYKRLKSDIDKVIKNTLK